MTLDEQIYSLLSTFGVKLTEDLKQSAMDALAYKGKRPREIALDFNQKIKLDKNGISFIIEAPRYWEAIENGRRAGLKAPPSRVLGKDWQSDKMDARKVLLDIQIKYNNKKHFNSASKGLSFRKHKQPKALSFDKATKTLAFLLARSIGKKGIKPKPFKDRVINDGRLEVLGKQISDLVGKNLIATVNI